LDRCEPHRYTGYRTHDKAHEHQELKVTVKKRSGDGAFVPHIEPLQVAHQKATTNGKLSEEDVEYTKTTNG
jgi:hypothetical protein